jgi:hypothetical protein
MIAIDQAPSSFLVIARNWTRTRSGPCRRGGVHRTCATGRRDRAARRRSPSRSRTRGPRRGLPPFAGQRRCSRFVGVAESFETMHRSLVVSVLTTALGGSGCGNGPAAPADATHAPDAAPAGYTSPPDGNGTLTPTPGFPGRWQSQRNRQHFYSAGVIGRTPSDARLKIAVVRNTLKRSSRIRSASTDDTIARTPRVSPPIHSPHAPQSPSAAVHHSTDSMIGRRAGSPRRPRSTSLHSPLVDVA